MLTASAFNGRYTAKHAGPTCGTRTLCAKVLTPTLPKTGEEWGTRKTWDRRTVKPKKIKPSNRKTAQDKTIEP